ncbi:NADPH-dependent FMN reductase, partial [Brevibacterium paucivorans]|uniref:NADPH-dependent FMN reductase n=1 Tax=Brevibacterium paucivorans TaxID=170994 RepID=UPI0027E537FA
PLYDFDYDDPEVTDKPVPAEYTEFRETIKASDGVLFVTPENNRTIPACLKNAVDIGFSVTGIRSPASQPLSSCRNTLTASLS